MSLSNRPLYLQVRDALAERIANGGLAPGSIIPSEGDLAREIGVSAGTVRKALHLMETDRLIVRQQGRGTFVSDLTSSELAARFTRLHGPNGARIRGRVTVVQVARGVANQAERDQLRLRDDDEVYRVRKVWQNQDTTFQVEDAALPAELFPRLEQKKQIADQIAVLAREYGILLGRARERVSTLVPSADIAEALGTPPLMPVAVLDRVLFMFNDRRPVEWRVAHCYLPGGYYLAEFR